MENIKIRITDNFQELTPVEGYVITSWDGEDIMNFTYSTTIVCPLNYNIDGYYTMTIQEAEAIEETIIKNIPDKV